MSSEDIQILVEIITGILNPDNNLRNSYIQRLDQLRQNTPALIICLFQIIKEIPNKNTKLIASVLISNILRIKDHEMTNQHWDKLSKNDRENIRQIIIQILKEEKDKKLKIKYCNLIHVIFDNSYETNETFIYVLEFIFDNIALPITEQNIDNIETSLELLSSNFTYLDNEFMSKLNEFLDHFRNFFKTDLLGLKTKAVKTIAQIIAYCDEDKIETFMEFILNLLETTLRAFENCNKCENELKECLISLNEISSSEPILLIKNFDDLYILMSKIIEKKGYMDEKIPELSFDIIVNTVERSPKLFTKSKEKLSHFFELLYKYALDLESDITDEWLSPSISNYAEDETTEEKPKMIFSFIFRLKDCLSSEIVLGQIQTIVEKLMAFNSDNDFRYKYVALLSIIEIATLFTDDITLLEHIFPFVNQQTLNENAKIRFAAISCIKVFNNTFASNYKKNHHETFMKLLLENIISEKVQRNQIEIINTLISFYESCPGKIGKIYLQNILGISLQFFLAFETHDTVSNLIRRKILQLINKIVRNSKENIFPFAEKIFSVILELFNSFYINKINSELYGDFLECLVLLGPYTESLYFSSLPSIVELIISIQSDISVASDPIRNSLESVYKNLIPILKNNCQFKQLLPTVINSILILVKNLPQMSLSSNPESEFNIENILSETNDSKENSKIIKNIQTSYTEDIASAIKLLKRAIKCLREEFMPYIEITQVEVLDLINYKINQNIRLESSKILHHIVEIIAEFSDKETLMKVAKNYLSKLVDSIEKEYDNSSMLIKIKHLGKIVQKSEYFLTKEELYSFFRKLTNLIDEIEGRRIKLVEEHKKLQHKKQNDTEKNKNTDEDDDYEEIDLDDPEQILKEDIEEIEDIQSYISDVIGFAFKTHKNISQEIIECIIKEWLPKYFKDNASYFEIKMGILIVDDMIEFLGQEFMGENLWNEMACVLIKYAVFSECKIRRAANYGLGILASHTKQNFHIYAEAAISALAASLQIQIESRNESEWGGAKDNATSSLGKFLKYQTNFVNIENCYYLWLRNLPILYDETESLEQHEILCDIISEKPEFGLGNDFVNLDHILRIFAKIYGTEKFSDEKIDAKIKAILRNWKHNEKIIQIVENLKNSSEAQMKKKITKLLQ